MTLEKWRGYGWLTRHETSPQEIADLVEAADRDISKAAIPELGPDWQLNIAHNAAVLIALAALAARGYRPSREGQRYIALESLEFTLGLDRSTLDELNALRKRRSLSAYERAGVVSEKDADAMLRLARDLRGRVGVLLRKECPDFLGE